MSNYLSGANNEAILQRKHLVVRLPFITQTIALAFVPFEELFTFQFGGILRIINLITIVLSFTTVRLSKIKTYPSTLYLTLFVFLAAISYLWCFNTGLYFDRILTYGLYLILIMVLGSLAPTSTEKNAMLNGLFIGGVIASALLLMTNVSSLGDRSTLMMFGKTVNPNRLSFSFALSINISTYKLLYSKKSSRINCILWVLSDILLVAGVVVSGSRSSFIVSLVCVFFLVWKRDFGNNSKLKRLFFVVFLLLIVYIIYSEFVLGSEFGDRFTLDNLTGQGDYGSANRDRIWDAALSQIIKKPILGYGNGASPYVIAELYIFYSTHNSYLMILLEFGIIGFIICFAMFISLYRRHKFQNNQLFCCFIVCILVDIIFVELFSAKVFWAVMLLLMVCQNNVDRKLK